MRWWVNNFFTNTVYYFWFCSHVSVKFSLEYTNEHSLSVLSKIHGLGYTCLFLLQGLQIQSKVGTANSPASCSLLHYFSLVLVTLSPAWISKHCLGYKTFFFTSFTFHICHTKHRRVFNCASQKQWSVLSSATFLTHFYFLYYKCSKDHCTFSVGYRQLTRKLVV